jgi:hypothetical protein
MITKQMMENWVGSDNMDADSFLDLLVDIANGNYPADILKEDVLDYANQG